MPFMKSLPDDAHAPHIFARYPHIYKLYSMSSRGIMRGPSPLSFAQRELLGAFVSALNGCNYCAGAHANTARMFGVDEGLLLELLDNVDSASIEPKLMPIFRFIRKLVETPTRIVQKDADNIFDAGWNDDALHSAVAVCSTFSFMNSLILGLGINASRSDYEDLGRARFGTEWSPMIPQPMPADAANLSEVYRATPPTWEFELAPETIEATDALFASEDV